MLDQSFSAANFRKIFDIENRKGNYLEAEFFPDVEKQSQSIQSCSNELRELKRNKSSLTPEKYEEEKENLSEELNGLKEKKEEMLVTELETVASAIGAKGFSFGIKEVDVGTPKKAYVAESSAPTFFALKQVQHNIRRLYKVKQANRHQIVCQLRELLGDNFPKYIVRTDISSFYESIPRNQLLKKLRDDPLLTQSSKKIIRRILFEYSTLTGSDIGLPRGIGISAYLAELYMRDIDSTMRDYPGVLYYSRYVDDIFVIFCSPPNAGTLPFRKVMVKALQDKGLKRNRRKTEIYQFDKGSAFEIQYLGYKFHIASSGISLRMTDKKLDRIKARIDMSFSAYDKQAATSEKKARRLLEKRVRFLTGNTRLVNNKKNVVAGIYFSNTLLTDLKDLRDLDNYLNSKTIGLKSVKLRGRLDKSSFEQGYKTRKYHKFSARDLSQIVEVWKHAS